MRVFPVRREHSFHTDAVPSFYPKSGIMAKDAAGSGQPSWCGLGRLWSPGPWKTRPVPRPGRLLLDLW